MRIPALALVAVMAAACASSVPMAAAKFPASRSTIAAAVKMPPLKCHALAASRRPRDHTAVKIRIRTAVHAWVTATGALAALDGQSAAGRASAAGKRTLRFAVGGATPGAQVIIDVHVSRNGRKGTCQASFRPRSATAMSPAQPAPSPTQPAASPTPAPSPPATAASCYPLSNEGTCYEPGEFCRASDHGASGVAGDGEKIICADNDGWRWEPA